MHVPLTPIRNLYRAVDLWNTKTGVVSGNDRFTYGEFGERCERLAGGLLAAGIRPGDRVAYLSFNNNQLLEGYFGIPLMRAIVMPLNVRLTPVELTGIHRLLPMKCSSTAVPWLAEMVLLVLTVLGTTLTP